MGSGTDIEKEEIRRLRERMMYVREYISQELDCGRLRWIGRSLRWDGERRGEKTRDTLSCIEQPPPEPGGA